MADSTHDGVDPEVFVHVVVPVFHPLTFAGGELLGDLRPSAGSDAALCTWAMTATDAVERDLFRSLTALLRTPQVADEVATWELEEDRVGQWWPRYAFTTGWALDVLPPAMHDADLDRELVPTGDDVWLHFAWREPDGSTREVVTRQVDEVAAGGGLWMTEQQSAGTPGYGGWYVTAVPTAGNAPRTLHSVFD